MLNLVDIHKTYEGQPLLRGVNLEVHSGETLCLLGSSGSGKSTLLRIAAGLEEAESGRVVWDGVDITALPAHQRNFGLMFQDYALFPHRSVAENVAFGLRMQGLSKTEIAARTNEALERVEMAAFGRRRVTDLSGGEQQRVALARALAPRPRLLMLDEPLAALDRALREQLGEFLREVLHQSGIPAIYVTHDQGEAFTIADRLVLLHKGLIEQNDAPGAVYRHPASAWVADFLGLSNLLAGTVTTLEPFRVHTALGDFAPANRPDFAVQNGQAVTVLLYPAGWRLSAQAAPVNGLSGVVTDCVFRGETYRVRLLTEAGLLQLNSEEPRAIGQMLHLAGDPAAIVCLQDAHE